MRVLRVQRIRGSLLPGIIIRYNYVPTVQRIWYNRPAPLYQDRLYQELWYNALYQELLHPGCTKNYGTT